MNAKLFTCNIIAIKIQKELTIKLKMLKTVLIATVSFVAASANFLTERDLQSATFTTLCTFTGGVDSCTSAGANYCCAKYTRGNVAPAAPFAANVCIHTDFIGYTLTIGGLATNFTGCLNTNMTVTPRTMCTNNTGCGASQCCTNRTVSVNAAGIFTNATGTVCVNPATFTPAAATYNAASWNTGYASSVSFANCTANPAATIPAGTGSFG